MCSSDLTLYDSAVSVEKYYVIDFYMQNPGSQFVALCFSLSSFSLHKKMHDLKTCIEKSHQMGRGTFPTRDA